MTWTYTAGMCTQVCTGAGTGTTPVPVPARHQYRYRTLRQEVWYDIDNTVTGHFVGKFGTTSTSDRYRTLR